MGWDRMGRMLSMEAQVERLGGRKGLEEPKRPQGVDAMRRRRGGKKREGCHCGDTQGGVLSVSAGSLRAIKGGLCLPSTPRELVFQSGEWGQS